jgi:hypothetical protein
LPADDQRGFVYPVAAYSHLPAPGVAPCDDTGFAVIGGFVYRGEALPELRGKYVFGDGVSGQVFYTEAADMRRGKELAKVRELTLFDGAGAAINLRTVAGDPKVLTAGKPRVDMKFGIDGKGELYVLAKANGTIWKVTGSKQVEPPVPSATPGPQPSPAGRRRRSARGLLVLRSGGGRRVRAPVLVARHRAPCGGARSRTLHPAARHGDPERRGHRHSARVRFRSTPTHARSR